MKKALPSQDVFQDASDRRAKDGESKLEMSERLVGVERMVGGRVARTQPVAVAGVVDGHTVWPASTAALSLFNRAIPNCSFQPSGARNDGPSFTFNAGRLMFAQLIRPTRAIRSAGAVFGIGHDVRIDAAKLQYLLGDFPSIPVHVAQDLALLQNAVVKEVPVVALFRLRLQAVGQPPGKNGMFSVVQGFRLERHALTGGRALGQKRPWESLCRFRKPGRARLDTISGLWGQRKWLWRHHRR